MTTTEFAPKTTKAGDIIWTSFFTTGSSAGGNTYVMVAQGATRLRFDDSRGVAEVRAVMNGTRIAGWQVVLFGDVVDTVPHKVTAQCMVAALFGDAS